MPAKKKPSQYPRKRAGAELVLKQNCHCDSVSTDGLASGVFILGNRNGIRWLSEYFARLADRIDDHAPYNSLDPDDHQHLGSDAPFNHSLSDKLSITVGSFSMRHRTRVFKACRITQQDRLPGNPITQFRNALDWITTLLADRTGGEEIRAHAVEELEHLIRQAEESIAKLRLAADRPKGEAKIRARTGRSARKRVERSSARAR